MIDENSKLTRVELDVVRLRYLAGLCNQEVANFLGLTLHQVKYRIKKPNVQRFIKEFIWPHIRDTSIGNCIVALENPVESHMNKLKWDMDNAMTYQWVGPGEKEFIPDNRKRLRALKMWGRIKGLRDHDRNLDRDWTNAIMKFVIKPQEDLKFLMEDRIGDYSERYERWKKIKRENEEYEAEQEKNDE